MATALEVAPSVTDSADSGVTHVYCCDPDTAWCGADISTTPEVPDYLPIDCPGCAELEPLPCPTCGS